MKADKKKKGGEAISERVRPKGRQKNGKRKNEFGEKEAVAEREIRKRHTENQKSGCGRKERRKIKVKRSRREQEREER